MLYIKMSTSSASIAKNYKLLLSTWNVISYSMDSFYQDCTSTLG